jgi:peptidoglycan/LPS O-acetylase OafA/YrhL
MWISFILPLVFLSLHLGAAEIYYLFYTTAAILVVGFLVYCWEDHRNKKPFSWGMLLYTLMMLFVYGVISPVMMSAAHVSYNSVERSAAKPY